MRWRKVTLVGVGLLGGSLGLALRKRGLAGEVHGYVRRDSSISECLQAGAVDKATLDLVAAVQNADLIVLCTPLARMEELAVSCAPHIAKDALVTDVGSVKGTLVRQLEAIFGKTGAHFVGSHPMAGSEKTGVGAARSDLFVNAACVITPTSSTPPAKVDELETLWRDIGGRVVRMSPGSHDEMVARSSHLPHLLAANLAAYVLGEGNPEQAKLCATGFKDSTRIASGSPEMWRDIVVMNRTNLKMAVDEFSSTLARFQALLDQNDPAAIEQFFQRAKELRDAWATKCSSPSLE